MTSKLFLYHKLSYPWFKCSVWWENTTKHIIRAHSRCELSQWETALLWNDVCHWLGANLESALIMWKLVCCSRGGRNTTIWWNVCMSLVTEVPELEECHSALSGLIVLINKARWKLGNVREVGKERGRQNNKASFWTLVTYHEMTLNIPNKAPVMCKLLSSHSLPRIYLIFQYAVWSDDVVEYSHAHVSIHST